MTTLQPIQSKRLAEPLDHQPRDSAACSGAHVGRALMWTGYGTTAARAGICAVRDLAGTDREPRSSDSPARVAICAVVIWLARWSTRSFPSRETAADR